MKYWIKNLMVASLGCALAGCGLGEIGSAASVGKGTSTGTGSASTSANSAPAIAGTPSTAVATGQTFTFTPTVSDANGDSLSFTITGKPAWATFNVTTGELSGTAQAGTFPNITITVTDGKTTKALPAFTLMVNAVAFTGTATLAWSAPSENTDGTSLSAAELSGYRIYHGVGATNLNQVIEIRGANNTRHVATQLPTGTHYFAVTAVSLEGVESAMSSVQSKAIL